MLNKLSKILIIPVLIVMIFAFGMSAFAELHTKWVAGDHIYFDGATDIWAFRDDTDGVKIYDDLNLTFGTGNDATIKYDEDSTDKLIITCSNGFTMVGALGFTGDILMATTSQIQFYDTALNIYGADDGDLVINADATLIVTSPATEIVATTSLIHRFDSGDYVTYTIADNGAAKVVVTGAVSGTYEIETSHGEILLDAANNITLDAGTGDIDCADDILMATDKKVQFRDTGVYIESYTDGRIRIIADGASSAAITLQATSAGDGVSGIYLLGHLRIYETDVDGTIDSQFWHDSSEGRMKFYDSGVHTIPITTDCILAATGGTIATTNRLYFNDATSYICSNAAGRIHLVATGASTAAITLDTSDAAGGIYLLGHLRIYQTDVDGAAESQIWYDDSEDRIKLYTTGVQTIPIKTDCILAATGGTIATTNRLNFNSANSYIYSHAADRIKIVATAATSDAITLDPSDVDGGIYFLGFLRVYETDIDGTVGGQLWYDSSEKKMKFFNGTATETINSGT